MKENKLSSKLKLQYFLAFLCMIIGLTGCAGDTPEVSQDLDNIAVSIRLSTGVTENTRAIDEIGNADESYIDPENLKILIFDNNEKLFDVLYDNGHVSGGTTLLNIAPGEYVLKTKLDPGKYKRDSEFAIVALANWQSIDSENRLDNNWNNFKINESEIGRLSMTDLTGMVMTLNPHKGNDQPESWMPDRTSRKGIPMFGSRFTSLKGYDGSRFNESNPMPVPDVLLVRALAKIEVVNNAPEDGDVITGIELVYRNQSGRLMQNFDFTSYTTNVIKPSLPDKINYTNNSLPFHNNGNIYTAYIPEMDLSERKAIRVNINIGNNVIRQKWIYLAPYDENGAPILNGSYGSDWEAIKRNYIYEYSISSLAAELNVELTIIKPENREINVPEFN